MTPHPSGNSNLASDIDLNFWTFFHSLLQREYGYFLALHNKGYSLIKLQSDLAFVLLGETFPF